MWSLYLLFGSSSTDLLMQILEDDKKNRDDKYSKDHTRKHTTCRTCANRMITQCRTSFCPGKRKQANYECKRCHQDRTQTKLRCFKCGLDQAHTGTSSLYSIFNDQD